LSTNFAENAFLAFHNGRPNFCELEEAALTEAVICEMEVNQ